MEQNEGTPVGYGRGRPTDAGALRRPLAYNTYASQEFVPTEGINPNGLFAETSWHDPSRDFSYMASPSGDHARPQNHTVTPDSNSSERKPVTSSQLSPFAKEFVPRNFKPEPRVPPTEVPEESLIDSLSDSYPVQELRSFLNEITMCPGKFERRIQPLTETLNSMVDDNDTMRAIVNIILDESVRQPNLRYSGARLCKTLCDDLVVPPDRLHFRTILLQRCNQEFKRRESLAQAEDGGTYFRGFAMFLAELFSQLEVKKQKINVLGDSLPILIKSVLAYGCTENFKCACQILKLVGAYLEDYERAKIENNGMAPEMDSIMCTLKNLSSNTEYSRSIRDMISSVIKLRESDWGRTVHSENSGYETPPPTSVAINDMSQNCMKELMALFLTRSSLRFKFLDKCINGNKHDVDCLEMDEPVMYGPDGKPLTPDEVLFLQSQYASNLPPDTDEYEAYEDNQPDEMTEEISEAYEIFLREQALRH